MHQHMHRAGLPLVAVSSRQHALTKNPLAPGRWGGREFPSVLTYMPARQQERAASPVPGRRGFCAGSSYVIFFARSRAAPMEGLVFFALWLTTAQDCAGQVHKIGAGLGYAGKGCTRGAQLWVRNIHHGMSQQQHRCRAGSSVQLLLHCRSGLFHLPSKQVLGPVTLGPIPRETPNTP